MNDKLIYYQNLAAKTVNEIYSGSDYWMTFLNTASKINAGLDIINAICRHEGISAPVFIDRAESVNEIMNTASQSVRLIVSQDKQLTIN